MFRRPESLRERTLLRLIERQQQTIADLNDRLMFLAGKPWEQAPAEFERRDDDELYADDSWTASPEQEPKF